MLTVLDTNVVISALLFRGETAEVHRLVVSGRVVPLVTQAILDEYVRVLSYPKLGLTDSEIAYLVDREIGRWFHMLTEPIPGDRWISEDPSDGRFVNAARVRPGTVLVSGDRHMIEMRESLPIRVLTAHELIEEMRGA